MMFFCSVIILCAFACVQLFANFQRIAFFSRKGVQKLGFSNFCVLSLDFENSLFLGLLKHYRNEGFQPNFVVFVVEKEEKGKTMINRISGLGFLVQKWPFREVHLFFKCFLGARFLGQVVKKGKFWTPTKIKRKS